MENNKYPETPILIVDDEKNILKSYELAFLSYGINNVICCNDSRQAMDVLRETQIDIVLLDLIMPHISGEELLKQINAEFPGTSVVMVTGLGKIDTAVDCMRNGAADYLLKPIKPEALLNRIKHCLELKELERENLKLKNTILASGLKNPEVFSEIVSYDKHMMSIFQYCEAIAESRHPVLITGETGVGKELFAKAIHKLSQQKGQFVAVNIAGFDDNLLSDTLFGHRRGAFTGAVDNRPGMIEKAATGTLFLDEIGDMPLTSQVKLLRLLQEKEYAPLGSDVNKTSDARIVLATNRSLDYMGKNKDFRKDLYFRISTHHVHIPPLRERKNDVRPILEHFLRKAAVEMGKTVPNYHPELITRLKSYNFPGNVRELEAMVYDAVSNHKSKMLSMKIFISHIERNSESQPLGSENNFDSAENNISAIFSMMPNLPTIKELSNALIQESLKRSDGNQSAAASTLGITPQALSARLKKLSKASSSASTFF